MFGLALAELALTALIINIIICTIAKKEKKWKK